MFTPGGATWRPRTLYLYTFILQFQIFSYCFILDFSYFYIMLLYLLKCVYINLLCFIFQVYLLFVILFVVFPFPKFRFVYTNSTGTFFRKNVVSFDPRPIDLNYQNRSRTIWVKTAQAQSRLPPPSGGSLRVHLLFS